ncbi:hypothetical protein AVDCRST_MAG94-6642 [uncultured Leptolyngbya sp.]|uniref:Uncharacterized protein n=1 Tax=uncultured Leptolyngbya sp. TaxID=332963 RepID=A0A6J4PHW6_9CYAN|nr:hypothetical protein AVDCRST_MAG94-6642 [uncultured Leptolyngbya sp.]
MPALRDSATADLAIATHYAQPDTRMRVVAATRNGTSRTR